MRYKSFRIQNFKGIKDTTINLQGLVGASVFAFVGLNESGKTTVLEAIHSFSPDDDTGELLGEKTVGVPYGQRVPRHQISSFTGDVSVTATAIIAAEEKSLIARGFKKTNGVTINLDTFPDEIVFERHQRFKDGDFIASYFSLRSDFQVKSGTQKKWRSLTLDEKSKLRLLLYSYTPDICYFPTFVFDFPERVYLTDRGKSIDVFYKSVFQDMLDYDGKGYTIEKDIIRRVRSENLLTSWAAFTNLWTGHTDKAKIQHVLDRASAVVTKVVFGRWNAIFGEDTRGKEISITYDIAEGEVIDPSGAINKTNAHDIFIRFEIRDGTRRFNVNDRSLGFRWFFAFMLFTQFRVARSSTRPLLFLFDEPASNLHAAAQQKLIDCFPEIAKEGHALVYTTHSHYMIEPKWLEQTFIVTNRSDAPPASVLDAVSLDDESLDIQVATYRSFVNNHPSQISYFQPILDRLEVIPSRFDLMQPSVVLEGRSDYYIMRYAAKMMRRASISLLPGLGAGTFGALAALHVGWNLNFLFILDSDRQGREERNRYTSEFGIRPARVLLLGELSTGVSEIEDLIDEEARRIIMTRLNLTSRPSKSQIKRFFQEALASDKVEELGPQFASTLTALLNEIESRLTQESPT